MKKHLRLSFSLLFIGIIFVLSACVDSFSDPALESIKEQKLIVEGQITTDLEKFTVSLSKSKAPLDKENPDIIANANIKIVDDLQRQFELPYAGFGVYQTATPQRAVVGRSYRVMIEINGQKYESLPELVKPVPPIDSLKYQFVENNTLGGYKVPSFEIRAEIQDNPIKGDYYRLDWINYQYLTSCQDRVNNDINILIRTNCCDDCWALKKIYGEINVVDDNLFNGKKITPVITNVPYNSRRPFFVEVSLYSTSAAAYQYWKIVKTQINNVGGIFDNPPAALKGNIKNVSNPAEEVLGFFGASALTRKQVYVLRSLAPYPPVIPKLAKRAVIDRTCIPCKEGPKRTPIRPQNWNDNYNTLFYDPLEEL
jgi:hypothetical protein